MLDDAVSRPSRFVYSLLAIIVIVSIVAWINWYIPEQVNKTTKTSYTSENKQINFPVHSKIEDQIDIDHNLSALEQDQQSLGNENLMTELSKGNLALSTEGVLSQNVDAVAQTNRSLVETLRLQKEAEYRQLIAGFNQVEGEEKVHLLQKIWQLATEVGIDENLLTLLHLATYDSDTRIESIAVEILNDLTRFMNGVVRPEVKLVSQITEIINSQQRDADQVGSNDGTQTIKSQGLDRIDSISSVEITRKRIDKINQLTLLALNSENVNQRDYALANLLRFNHDSALEVIQHQLLTSVDSDERYRAIEKLMAAAGEVNSMKLREILEIAANDYESSVAEYAQASMVMFAQYEYNISENAAVGANSSNFKEPKTCRSCGYN